MREDLSEPLNHSDTAEGQKISPLAPAYGPPRLAPFRISSEQFDTETTRKGKSSAVPCCEIRLAYGRTLSILFCSRSPTRTRYWESLISHRRHGSQPCSNTLGRASVSIFSRACGTGSSPRSEESSQQDAAESRFGGEIVFQFRDTVFHVRADCSRAKPARGSLRAWLPIASPPRCVLECSSAGRYSVARHRRSLHLSSSWGGEQRRMPLLENVLPDLAGTIG